VDIARNIDEEERDLSDYFLQHDESDDEHDDAPAGNSSKEIADESLRPLEDDPYRDDAVCKIPTFEEDHRTSLHSDISIMIMTAQV
jgi:hypothetical protein